MPAPTHNYEDYQLSGGNAYEKHQSTYSDNNDDDGARLYSFGTIKMHSEQSRDPDMQNQTNHSMSPAAAAAKHLSNSAFTNAIYPQSQDYEYVGNWVATNNQYNPSEQAHQASYNQNAGSSIDDLVETMLESFSGQPSTVSSKAPPPPEVPLPTILPEPYGQDKTMSISVDHKRKANAKRKLLQEAMAENDEDDFLDSDSDAMSSRGVSPRNTTEPESKWKPSSVNYDSIAAHIAQALNQPSDSNTREDLHVANQVDSYEISSVSDDYDTPPASRSGPPPAPSLPASLNAPRNGPPPAPPLP
ncbi:hypothetical protein IWW42_002347 [Coemansia sp. RSA 1085]|nr:hypothetical protein IWW42_002347 [Coemansia sp. RSA 1085]